MSLINFSTSIYAGIVIFAILGYKANLSYDKCVIEREQKIDYYLSDYNLKMIDYGSVFNSVIKESDTNKDNQSSNGESNNNISLKLEDLQGSPLDYYDSSDAIASIRSLDRQLDASSDTGPFDVGDKDTEFIIDASSLISKEQLDKVIGDIPGLPQCSVRQELDDSSQGSGLVFVVMAEAISQFESDAGYWATGFFFMLLMLGLDSQFGNLEGLLSSLADLNFANSIRRQWITGKLVVALWD